jgi:hypothetical protein
MEPNDDPKLRALLKEWTAPATPPALKDRILRARQPWWQVMLTGYIRVPVPLACCLVALLAAGAWRTLRQPDITPCNAIVIPAPGCQPDTKC